MKRVYVQCCGHWYTNSKLCPLDGYGPAGVEALWHAVSDIEKHGGDVSVAALRDRGVSDTVLNRVLVIEFGLHAQPADVIEIGAGSQHGEGPNQCGLARKRTPGFRRS